MFLEWGSNPQPVAYYSHTVVPSFTTGKFYTVIAIFAFLSKLLVSLIDFTIQRSIAPK